jgi:osmoprotectant transport system permease protein
MHDLCCLKRLCGRLAVILVQCAALAWGAGSGVARAQQAERELRIGSKSFTESVILGEMLTALAQHAGSKARHRSELGGTQVLWQALKRGEIDAYVEYTGTLTAEILVKEEVDTLAEVRERLASAGVSVCDPLGFNNTYAIGMLRSRADQLGISKISDLSLHPEFKLGFSDEFVERSDCWHGMKEIYGLPHTSIRGMDHSLAYRAIATGAIDVIDLYSTDAEIISYDLRILDDDLAYFPLYEAVILYRSQLEESHPQVVEQFKRLISRIDSQRMARMNKESRIERRSEALIAAEFLRENVDSSIVLPRQQGGWFQRRAHKFLLNTWEHCYLVGISLMMAILVSIPLGIFAYKRPQLGEWILGTVGVIQTIPSMALLVFMIPLLGLGAKPAIVALFLYSLLPIVRGTYTGLCGLPSSLQESAQALGLSDFARLRLIELPLAAQSILAGIKTSAVINVGTATIGALIGAGGYGQPIITGIRLADLGLILQGAIPAAAMALVVQYAFSRLERIVVPAGLRG